MNDALQRSKLRSGLDNAKRRLLRFRIRGLGGLFVIGVAKPSAKSARSNRPCLAMPVDLDVSVACAVRSMEQFRPSKRDRVQTVRLGLPWRRVGVVCGGQRAERMNPPVSRAQIDSRST